MLDETLDDISHRRYNPLRGSWVLVSPHRTKRPWQGAQETPSETTVPEYDAKCYLCPGNSRASGDENPPYESTFAFLNDFSAVKEQQAEYHSRHSQGTRAANLLKAEPVTGKCYVLCFNPAHNLTLADLSPDQIVPIIEKWTEIYTTHLSPKSPLRRKQLATTQAEAPNGSTSTPPPPTTLLKYMQIFENKGSAMGCSNPHPHGQIWTTSTIPEEPALELTHLQQYRRDNHGAHMLVDYCVLETEQQEEDEDNGRVVYSNASFLAVCPWWAVWPFEVLISAREHRRALTDFDDAERLDLADAISHVTRKYDNLFQTHFPYSMGIHQAPLDGSDDEKYASHFHVHFYPPLLRSASVKKFMVGFELMGEPQRDITPEQAAKRLRACNSVLYRESSTK